MRRPNGDVWIPQPEPPGRTGLFGRARHTDWENHVLAAASQVRYLARHSELLQRALDAAAAQPLITDDQAAQWAGRPLTAEDIERLADAVQHSSIPEAIDTIVSSWDD